MSNILNALIDFLNAKIDNGIRSDPGLLLLLVVLVASNLMVRSIVALPDILAV